MPHIPLQDGLPGIVGLLAFKPASGVPLAELMHQLLRGHSPLSPAERELIAAYVSGLNNCGFCARSHAAAMHHLEHGPALRTAVTAGPADQALSPRLAALLRLAAAVAEGGQCVTGAEVAAARQAGAGDEEIHDTVLIAAAFCMLNRYVDGLGTEAPDQQPAYDQMGARLAEQGYRQR